MEEVREDGSLQQDDVLQKAANSEYKYGFTSDIDTEIVPPGLDEDVIRFISKVKGEPDWLLAVSYTHLRAHETGT